MKHGKQKKGRYDKLIRKPEKLIAKLQKWCTKGKASKLQSLLAGPQLAELVPELLRIKDAHGQSLLHLACRCGHTDVVAALLRAGADTEAQDRDQSTPAHAAAAAGHLSIVAQLLQCDHPPDVDLTNARGVSIRDCVEQSLAAPAAGVQHSHAHPPGGGGEMSDEDEDAAWRRRLREEASDDELGGAARGGGWGRGAGAEADEEGAWASWHSATAGSWGVVGGETEDAWVDRMWAEMQGRRRREAEAASRAFASSMARDKAREEAAARAAAAAVNSARILEQERAKDSAWRRRATGPHLPGEQLLLEAPDEPLEPPPDPGAAHAAYEAHWLALEVQLQAGPSSQKLAFADLPWPLPPRCAITVGALRDVVLHDVKSAGDIKKRVRRELMRWHPDKFMARLGPHLLAAADVARVSARAKEVSQALTQLMST